jgi:hypothetical protein
MTENTERLVPKVHPATRAVGPDDPYSLHATAVSGDPEVMLTCLIQEYAWMGWDLESILSLTGNPGYPLLHGLSLAYGPDGLRRRIAEILAKAGVFRYSGVVQEAPEQMEDYADLIELGLPTNWRTPLSGTCEASISTGAEAAEGGSNHGHSL